MKLRLKHMACLFLLSVSVACQAVYLHQWSGGKRDRPLSGPGDKRPSAMDFVSRPPVVLYGSMIVSSLGVKKTDGRAILPQASSFISCSESLQKRALSRTGRIPAFLEGELLVVNVEAMVATRKPKK